MCNINSLPRFILIFVNLLIFFSIPLSGQVLKGRVFDENYNFLNGATIYNSTLKKSIITDSLGKFEIISKKGENKYTISFVGFKAKVLKITFEKEDFIETEVVLKKDCWILWDDLKMTPAAAKMTGWTESKYNKLAEPADKILEDFDKYLYNESYINVGHNILGFDVYIHNIHRILCNKKSDYSYLNRAIDTNSLAKAKSMGIDLNNDCLLLFISSKAPALTKPSSCNLFISFGLTRFIKSVRSLYLPF